MTTEEMVIPPYVRPKPFEWPPGHLPYEDNDILENTIHYAQMDLLWFTLEDYFHDRNDFYVGGNMFLYYSPEQRMNRDFRGPDVFFVWGVDRWKKRKYYATWEENITFPNFIVELTSPTTAHVDFGEKKELYSRIFKTTEYVCYDPETYAIYVWRLDGSEYVPVEPGTDGRYEITSLGLRLGFWEGKFKNLTGKWIRYFTPDGQLVLNAAELAQLEAAQAKAQLDQQQARTAAAEAEVERLKTLLANRLPKTNGPHNGETS